MNVLKIIGFFLLANFVPELAASQTPDSGLAIGTDCPAFDPVHISGPDRGTKACPMCKYGYQQGVMIWVNDNDWSALGTIAKRLETEMDARGVRKFRAFIMYMNPDKKPSAEVMKTLSVFSAGLKLNRVALTFIPNPSDPETAGLFEINPDKNVRNTVLIYKKRKVAGKLINLEPASLNELMSTCDKLFSNDSF